MKIARTVVLLAGIGMIVHGAKGLWDELEFGRIAALGGWLAGSVVLHDAVLLPLIMLAGTVLWRLTRRAHPTVRRILVSAAAVTGLLVLLAWPLITQRGPVPHDSARPGDYAAGLLVLLALTGAITAPLVGWTRWRHRNRDP